MIIVNGFVIALSIMGTFYLGVIIGEVLEGIRHKKKQP